MDTASKTNLTRFLENTPQGVLVQLLVHACEEDERLYADVMQKMLTLHGTEMGAITRTVERAIARAQEYDDYLTPEGAYDVQEALEQSLMSAAAYATEGRSDEALDVAVYVLQTIARIEEYLEEGWELSGTADEAIDRISEIVSEAEPSMYPALTDHILAAATGPELRTSVSGTDYNLRILSAAIPMADRENEQRFLTAIDDFAGSGVDKAVCVVHRDIIQHVEGQKAAHAYMVENIDLDVFRESLVDDAMANGQFNEAEAMCVERIAQAEAAETSTIAGYRRAAGRRDWMRKLHDVYAASGDTEKLTEQTLRMVREGDTEYYDEAKRLLTAVGRWKGLYTDILMDLASSAGTSSYMQILSRESEDELLLEKIRDRNRGAIFQYGADLFSRRPQDVIEIATDLIEDQSQEAAPRKHYAHIGVALEQLASFGAVNEALALLDSLVNEYPRRSALKQELNVSRGRIQRGDPVPSDVPTYWM